MYGLITPVSALTAVLVLITQIIGYASLERALLASAGAGLTIYVALVVGYTAVQQIMRPPPPSAQPAAADAPEGAAPEAST